MRLKKLFMILGGGQAAMDVKTTTSRQGKFEGRFLSQAEMVGAYLSVLEEDNGEPKSDGGSG